MERSIRRMIGRFEVPGWQVRPAESVNETPDSVGLWTSRFPPAWSRGADWLCTTWYATIDVLG